MPKVANMKTAKKLTPPKEGLDWLLHRTTTSFLLRIPRDCENRNKSSLQSRERSNPLIRNIQIIFNATSMGWKNR